MKQRYFRKRWSTPTCVLSLLLLCSCGDARSTKGTLSDSTTEFKIGELVCWKPDVDATVDGNPVDINTIRFPAVVVEFKGEKLLLAKPWNRYEKVKVWVSKSDVMKKDVALGYYSRTNSR